jgi:hypothetical protein
MAASKRSAREELERLRGVVATRMRAVDEIDAERQRALSAVEVARQQQREFYARQEPGGKPAPADEQRHTAAVQEAQRAADAPWHARKEGARLAVENAHRDVQAFLSQSFEQLAAELLPPSMAAQARLAAAFDEVEVALEEWATLRHEWSRITVAAGIPPDELPDLDPAPIQAALPDDVPVPAPASLVGRRELVNANGGGK